MASFEGNSMPQVVSTATFFVGSCVFVADGSGGFDSHLIDPRALETSEAARCRAIDDFVDHLDKIPIPVHVEEVRERPDFDVMTS
jgi:hypothetical protein